MPSPRQPAYKTPTWPMLAVLAVALYPALVYHPTPHPAAVPVAKKKPRPKPPEEKDTFYEEMKAEFGDAFGRSSPIVKRPPGA